MLIEYAYPTAGTSMPTRSHKASRPDSHAVPWSDVLPTLGTGIPAQRHNVYLCQLLKRSQRPVDARPDSAVPGALSH